MDDDEFIDDAMKKKIMIRMTVTWFFGSELWSRYVLLLTINDYNAITYKMSLWVQKFVKISDVAV